MRVRVRGEGRRAVHGGRPARGAGEGAAEAGVEGGQRAADAAARCRVAAARGFGLRVLVGQRHARRRAATVSGRRAGAGWPHLRLVG